VVYDEKGRPCDVQSKAPEEWGIAGKKWMKENMVVPEIPGSQFLRQVASTLKRKHRPTVTENLRLSLGPEEAREGYLVFILLGCSIPLLLRKVDHGTDEDHD
jgi:hypothetical protein